MLAKPGEKGSTIRLFRAHSWIVRLVAAATLVIVVLPVATARGASPRTSWVLVGALLALGLAIPAALLVWDRQRGVHVRRDGIRSVSANGSRFLDWRDIQRFEIDKYMGGTLAVFAVSRDGARIPLGDTARWPYQRESVERVRDELADYRDQLRPPETGA